MYKIPLPNGTHSYRFPDSKVVNVGVDVLEQVRIGSERENAEGRGVVSYRSSLTLVEQS